METLIQIILVVLAIVLVIYILVNYVIPVVIAVSKVATMIIVGIAFLIGLFFALKNYIISIIHNINFINWDWEEGKEPARRSYFFGPGYVQMFDTIKEAFGLNFESGVYIIGIGTSFFWEDCEGFWGILKWIAGLIFMVAGCISVGGIGLALCVIFGTIHIVVTTIFMLLSYIVFLIVWILDFIYLFINKIRSDCPICKKHFLIPIFQCSCGRMHYKLVPNSYGIWHHKCTCGRKIPSSVLSGRSRLEAYSPCCNSPLVASDARPIVFQLIGGSKAGKTVYLSAFFHEYLKKLSNHTKLKVTIDDKYKPYFDELEEWYSGRYCPATAQLNSQMYPILIDSSLGVKRQFSIYDIAVEMFDGITSYSVRQERQFHYCDGFLFLIDPFSSGKLRRKKINAGEDMSDFSNMAADDVATNFINYLIHTGHAKANVRCNIPISVLIVKSDIKEVKDSIGYEEIEQIFHNSEQYITYESARDNVCRQFLIDIGFTSTIENLEIQFSNLHYFPVSAMGHSPDGTPYKPWGITEAIEWMLSIADKKMFDLITSE